jgi:hypothetical protein
MFIIDFMTYTQIAPQQWAKDRLTEYIENCRTNQFATFANKPAFKLLLEIDDCFFKILDKPINPRPWFPFQFIHRSHSSWRAACGMVMSGQVQEANAMLRLSLETAAYGYYISTDSSIAEAWIKRNDWATELRDFKKKFQHVTVKQKVIDDAPKLGRIFEQLYERTIDYGAHPNERGFSLNSNISEIDDTVEWLQIYLQGDGLPLDFALKSTAQIGVWNLAIFQLVYPQKWELLGLKAKLEEFWRVL